jgi:hypothetical protein
VIATSKTPLGFREPRPAENPLARPWSRLERIGAAVLVVALIAGLIASAVVGISSYQDGRRRERAQAGRVKVEAVVVSPDPVRTPVGRGATRGWATVAWVDGAGRHRGARTSDCGPCGHGSHVTVWTDGRGTLVAAPSGTASVVLPAVVRAAVVLAGTAAVVVAGSALVRWLEHRRRVAGWVHEGTNLHGGG